MRSSSREEIGEVLDALRAAHKRARDLTFDVLTTPDRLAVLENLEQMRRAQPAIEHALINQLAEQADPTELGGTLAAALAHRSRTSRPPDAAYPRHDPARPRAIVMARRDINGMSPISGYLTPEARATIDAVFAKLAAPGMCNPDDVEPCVSGTPSQAAIQA